MTVEQMGSLAVAMGVAEDDEVQAQLADMVARGAKYAVMEISSHGLDQNRVAALYIDTAIFTNLTRDHLDYHGDFERYGAAKAKLFSMPGLKSAVINIDDRFGRKLMAEISEKVDLYSYSIDDRSAAIYASELQLHQHVCLHYVRYLPAFWQDQLTYAYFRPAHKVPLRLLPAPGPYQA